jgi:hypothetical protein
LDLEQLSQGIPTEQLHLLGEHVGNSSDKTIIAVFHRHAASSTWRSPEPCSSINFKPQDACALGHSPGLYDDSDLELQLHLGTSSVAPPQL